MTISRSTTPYSTPNVKARIAELCRLEIARQLERAAPAESATVASVELMLRRERKPGNAARCPLGCTDVAWCQRTGCVCAYPEDGAA